MDTPNFDATAIQDLDAAAATIKDAVGPSGPNRDYLLNLATWLAEVGEEDEHVAQLFLPSLTAHLATPAVLHTRSAFAVHAVDS